MVQPQVHSNIFNDGAIFPAAPSLDKNIMGYRTAYFSTAITITVQVVVNKIENRNYSNVGIWYHGYPKSSSLSRYGVVVVPY